MKNWPQKSSHLLGKRSAATPPSGVVISIAKPNTKNTMPSAPSRSVRSHANSPRSSICIWTPMNEYSALHHSTRYAGTRSEAKVAMCW